MSSMESSLVVDQTFSVGKQMKKTCQNVSNNNNPHNYLHQIAGMSSDINIPRQSNKLSQNYAKPPQVMHEYDKMMMMKIMHGGLYLYNQQQHAPPYHHHHHHHHLTNSFPPIMSYGQHQPPLLPFPPAASRPAFHSKPPLRRSQSLSPPVIVPRKTPAKNKKENKRGIDNKGGAINNHNSVELSSTDKVGKQSSKARKRSEVSIGPTKENGPNDQTRMMSDVVFRMAPPPSSLPLPRFTLRKQPPPPPPPSMKLRCNAEAAAVDGAATDNICMLLRLR